MDYTEFQSKFPEEQWFKVVAYDPVKQQFFRRNLFFTVDSVTTDHVPFKPFGECRAGGIYFASLKHIDLYCDIKDYGEWVAPVTFVSKSNGIPTRFYLEQNKAKANQIVLGQPIPLKQFCFDYIHRNHGLFSVAAKYGYENVVQLGLESGVVGDPSAQANGAIRQASENGHIEVVRLLLTDPRVDPSALDNYAIRFASQNGHLDVVRLLLTDPRVDPSPRDNYAIRWVSEIGHLEMVRLLLTDPRVDPSARDNEAIRLASKNGHVEVVRLLLTDPRVDPSAQDNQAIYGASYNGHVEVVRLLLTDPRVDPSAQDNYAQANGAIRQASENGHLDVVRLLLTDPRVDPSAQDNYAVRWAKRNGHDEVVQLLLTDPRVSLPNMTPKP
jgi:hypothetical protein